MFSFLCECFKRPTLQLTVDIGHWPTLALDITHHVDSFNIQDPVPLRSVHFLPNPQPEPQA